jgi:hypothetical protein
MKRLVFALTLVVSAGSLGLEQAAASLKAHKLVRRFREGSGSRIGPQPSKRVFNKNTARRRAVNLVKEVAAVLGDKEVIGWAREAMKAAKGNELRLDMGRLWIVLTPSKQGDSASGQVFAHRFETKSEGRRPAKPEKHLSRMFKEAGMAMTIDDVLSALWDARSGPEAQTNVGQTTPAFNWSAPSGPGEGSLSQLVGKAKKVIEQKTRKAKKGKERGKQQEEELVRKARAFKEGLVKLEGAVSAAMDLAGQNTLDLLEHTRGEVPLIFTRDSGMITVHFAKVYDSYIYDSGYVGAFPSSAGFLGYYVDKVKQVALEPRWLESSGLTIDKVQQGLKLTLSNLLPQDAASEK